MVYRVGTLSYTRSALIGVFFWMLWGDFCLTIMEAVIPRLVPLQLKSAGASSAMIGLLVGSVPSAMNFVMNPIISTRSDRHRGPLGRRMPYLLWPTPFVAICMVLVGFSPAFAHLLYSGVTSIRNILSERQLTICVIGLFTVFFTFFNLFITSVYYYLFTDVIPQQVMGKFTCLFRVVGALGAVVFNRWILGYADHHSRAIYAWTGLIYMAAFLLLIWQVKEGQYPTPQTAPARPHLLTAAGTYFRECFVTPFYLKLYAVGLLFWCASAPLNTFIVFYATRNLGLSLDAFGKALSWAGLATIPAFLLLGPIVDRFHPVRVTMVGLFAMSASSLLAFVFIHTHATFLALFLIYSLTVAVYWGGNASLMPRLLPRLSYGQFCSANSMVTAVGLVIAPSLCGLFLDLTGDNRFIFLWASTLAGVGGIMAWLLYRHWIQLGGDAAYAAPIAQQRKFNSFLARGDTTLV